MINTDKKRLRRTMIFLNAQKPGLVKGPYICRPDSIMLDLEGAMAENQKDMARFSLYRALKTIDYQGYKKVVRIDGLDTPYWKEDIRCTIAGGYDAIRIPETERPEGVRAVEGRIGAAEEEFDIPKGHTLIMAAIESARGVIKALNMCEASERLFGIALSDGNYIRDLQARITGTGIELMGTRQNMIVTARTVGVQCFGTVYTNLDDMEGFRRDVETIHLVGSDGKSIINPRQITIVHKVFTFTPRDIIFTEKVVKEIDDKKARRIGVFTVNGEMIDMASYDGAGRIIALAKASGVCKGDL